VFIRSSAAEMTRTPVEKVALHHNMPVHVALDFQNFLSKTNLQWFNSNPITLMSLQQHSLVPETEILINRMLISICRDNK